MTHQSLKSECGIALTRSEYGGTRRFHDFTEGTPGRIDTSKLGFIPGGSYVRGRYPALDRELDSLKRGLDPAQDKQADR